MLIREESQEKCVRVVLLTYQAVQLQTVELHAMYLL